MKTRTFILPGVAVAVALLAPAHAADAPSASMTGNVAVTTDYMFRGLTQSWGCPAIQGGADLALADGFAAGAWGSSISGNSYPGGSMELDLYASYGGSLSGAWSWRAGLYGYVYPGANLDAAGLPSRSLNTDEANLALTWKQFTLKYNYALTDYFGADVGQDYRADSRGTQYLQLDAAFPLADAWSLALHAGYTDYATALAVPNGDGARNPDYPDFGATLKYQFAAHWSASLGLTRATNDRFYRHTGSFTNPGEVRNVGGTRAFVMLQGTF
ncbi:TorF family putative porin [Frateuria terrea]|uniref:Uncharacterized protein n=1 Tax=Frateuria terrea TaxID=529704 RepID=A0A1H6Y500_9GAMM|nr:TorF family putative porin [Frateuria terrea]SEJ36349.1 conserved hypothetical protein [Frateuria terrea]SFP48882.1 conserved hypothetical protein [Frateuria terrea]